MYPAYGMLNAGNRALLQPDAQPEEKSIRDSPGKYRVKAHLKTDYQSELVGEPFPFGLEHMSQDVIRRRGQTERRLP